jgi:hypothetical protein
MSAQRPKFMVGQVVAFRKQQEVLWRYGRVYSEVGPIFDYNGAYDQGYRVLEGNSYHTVPQRVMRALTVREAGQRSRRRVTP